MVARQQRNFQFSQKCYSRVTIQGGILEAVLSESCPTQETIEVHQLNTEWTSVNDYA